MFNANPVNGRLDPTRPVPRAEDRRRIGLRRREQGARGRRQGGRVRPPRHARRPRPVFGRQPASVLPHDRGRLCQGNDSTDADASRLQAAPKRDLGDVSRPEAIGMVDEFAVDERGQRKDGQAGRRRPRRLPPLPRRRASLPPCAPVVACRGSRPRSLSTSPRRPSPAHCRQASHRAPARRRAVGQIGSLFGGRSRADGDDRDHHGLRCGAVAASPCARPASSAVLQALAWPRREPMPAVEPAAVPLPGQGAAAAQRQAQAPANAQIAMTTPQ